MARPAPAAPAARTAASAVAGLSSSLSICGKVTSFGEMVRRAARSTCARHAGASAARRGRRAGRSWRSAAGSRGRRARGQRRRRTPPPSATSMATVTPRGVLRSSSSSWSCSRLRMLPDRSWRPRLGATAGARAQAKFSAPLRPALRGLCLSASSRGRSMRSGALTPTSASACGVSDRGWPRSRRGARGSCRGPTRPPSRARARTLFGGRMGSFSPLRRVK